MTQQSNCIKVKKNYKVLGLLENPPQKSPLILLLHGAGGDLHHYDTVSPILVSNGYRVLVVDVRFHGESQLLNKSGDHITTTTFSVYDVLADLRSTLQEVKQTHYAEEKSMRLIIGGLSMGGMISMLWATHYSLDEELLANSTKGIILEGVILIAAGIPHMQIPRVGWEIYAERKATAEHLVWTRSAIIQSAITKYGQEETARAMELISDHNLYECMVAIATLLPSPSPDQPAIPYELKFKKPMLLIIPDEDPYTRPEMELLHQLNQEHGVDSELIILSDSGHMAILDKGEEIGTLILNFCNRLTRSKS